MFLENTNTRQRRTVSAKFGRSEKFGLLENYHRGGTAASTTDGSSK